MVEHIKLVRYRYLNEAGVIPNRTTLSRWLKRPIDPFPPPLRLGDNFVAWRLSDVEAWLKRRTVARREGVAVNPEIADDAPRPKKNPQPPSEAPKYGQGCRSRSSALGA